MFLSLVPKRINIFDALSVVLHKGYDRRFVLTCKEYAQNKYRSTTFKMRFWWYELTAAYVSTFCTLLN